MSRAFAIDAPIRTPCQPTRSVASGAPFQQAAPQTLSVGRSGAQNVRVSITSIRRQVRSSALVTAVAAIAVGMASQAVAVSTPTPNPPVNCPGEPSLPVLGETPAYALAFLSAATVHPSAAYLSQNQAVALSWSPIELDDGCVAVYVRAPGEETFPDQPHTRLGPREDRWEHQSINAPGEYCYRLIAIGVSGHGPFAETCVTVEAVANVESDSDRRTFAAIGLTVCALLGGLGLVAIRRFRRR